MVSRLCTGMIEIELLEPLTAGQVGVAVVRPVGKGLVTGPDPLMVGDELPLQ
jgi:hypothetical protein